MADTSTLPIASGDYVRIIRGAYASEFGYVVSQHEDVYAIALDQSTLSDDENEFPLPAVIDCIIDDLELVREHNTIVRLDVQNFIHQSFPVYGVTASTNSVSQSNMMDPESALGRLHRTTIAELPPPHTVDSVFADMELKELYFRIFRGEYSICWMHVFPDVEAIRTGFPILRIGLAGRVNGRYSNPIHLFIVQPKDNGEGVYYCQSSLALPGLSANQTAALHRRVLHHFLRLAGVDIGSRIRKLLSNSMSSYYQSLKWWPEALDIAIVKADLALVSKEPVVHLQLSKLAHALMACKGFRLQRQFSSKRVRQPMPFRNRQHLCMSKPKPSEYRGPLTRLNIACSVSFG